MGVLRDLGTDEKVLQVQPLTRSYRILAKPLCRREIEALD